MQAKFLILGIITTGLSLFSVDFAPMENSKIFEMNFNHGRDAQTAGGLKPEKIGGENALVSKGFSKGALCLTNEAEVVYPADSFLSRDVWTLWFWLNTNNIHSNTGYFSLENTSGKIYLGLDPRNGFPFMAAERGGAEIFRINDGTNIDGIDWNLFTIWRNGDECGLMVNGVSAGSQKFPLETTAKGGKFTLKCGKNPIIKSTVNNYDDITVYGRVFDDFVMKTHYTDELRAYRGRLNAYNCKIIEPDNFVYEFIKGSAQNAIKNGSFEYGSKGWYFAGDRDNPEISGIVQGDAVHGKFSVRLENGKNEIEHYPVSVKGAGAFTLSFFAKSSSPKNGLMVKIKNVNHFAEPKKSLIKTFKDIDSGYRKYTVSGFLNEDTRGVTIGFLAETAPDSAIWIDAVQFYSGKAEQDFKPDCGALFIFTDKPFNAFIDDEPTVFSLMTDGYADFSDRKIMLRITDCREKTVSLTPILGEGKITVDLNLKGAFRATVEVDGKVVDEQLFSRIYRPASVPPVESRYGGHYHNKIADLRFAQIIGSHWNRNHDAGPAVARWSEQTAPAEGKFNYRFDIIKMNRDCGQEILANIDYVPHKDVEKFGENVRALVKGYKGELKYIEIFNEPTAVIPPDIYAKLLKTAYKSIKETDSNARVVGMATWDVVAKFTREVIDKTGFECMDVFACHFYNWGAAAWLMPDGDWGQGFRLRALRGFMDANGGKNIPIWHDESGIYINSFYKHFPCAAIDTKYSRAVNYRHHSPLAAAIWMAQVFPVNFANGAQIFFYYAWGPNANPQRMGGHELGELDFSLKPAAAAYSASAHFLDTSIFAGGLEDQASSGLRVFEFIKDGKSLVVAWSQADEPVFLSTDSTVYFDFLGNRISYSKNSRCGEREATLNKAGSLNTVTVPATENRLFLDMEPKYFTGMTIKEFAKILPENKGK